MYPIDCIIYVSQLALLIHTAAVVVTDTDVIVASNVVSAHDTALLMQYLMMQ